MLSLAIGREGQNARLAAKMTGWRIDIRSDQVPAPDAPPRPLVRPTAAVPAAPSEAPLVAAVAAASQAPAARSVAGPATDAVPAPPAEAAKPKRTPRKKASVGEAPS